MKVFSGKWKITPSTVMKSQPDRYGVSQVGLCAVLLGSWRRPQSKSMREAGYGEVPACYMRPGWMGVGETGV